jgi:glycosyltransferase involved in cell wall biosynthesis
MNGEMKAIRDTLIVLSPGFPENEADTTCLPAQQALITALNAGFKNLHIIVLSFQYPFISASYRWNGNRIIPFNGRNKGKLSRLLTWLRVWRMLKKLNRKNKIIGILSFWCTECGLLGAWFGRKYSIRHFIWILGQDARKQNRFVSWIRPAAGDLLAMSPFLAAEFHKNHGVRPAFIIPNGIAATAFPVSNTKKDIDFLGVGSLIPLKQFDVFIRVIGQLRDLLPGVSAVICGKGPQEEALRKMILDSDLQKNISLAGEITHAEVLEWMSRSRLLLHPSSYEGFSTVCLEALYSGAHVISFCDPLIGDIPHWHIVNTEEEMTALALEIIRDPGTDYNRELVYSMDDSAGKLMKLFCAGRSRASLIS